MATKRWGELTQVQQKLLVALVSAEVALTTAALTDLARRPVSQVRGSKRLWVAACFVQPVGPVAYLLLGHRRD